MIAPLRGLRNLWRRSFAWKVAIVAVSIYIPVWLTWEVASHVMARRVTEAWEFANQYGLPEERAGLVGPEIAPEKNAAIPLRKAVLLAWEALAVSPDFQSNSFDVNPEQLIDPSKLHADPRYETALIEADRLAGYRSIASIEHPWELPADQIAWDTVRLASTEVAIANLLDRQQRPEEALERLLRLARLTRKWRGKEPTQWAFNANVGIESSVCFNLNDLLRKRPELDPRCFDAIEREFTQPRNDLHDTLIGIQAARIDAVANCQHYAPTGSSFFSYPYDALDLLHTLDFFNRSMQHLSLPVAEATAAQKRMEEQYDALRKDWFHRLLHPISSEGLTSFQTDAVWMQFSKANIRCLRIVNAMARKRDFNADLDSLGLPPECLVDPYDDKRLRIKRTPEGPIVYSVGHNFIDDGGDVDKSKDYGLGPPKKEAKK